MVGPGLLAQILVSKYEYHQPLYRQEKMFRQQFGVDLSRKTMGCWVKQASELLKPVYRSARICCGAVICKPMRPPFDIWTRT
jgi:transposase